MHKTHTWIVGRMVDVSDWVPAVDFFLIFCIQPVVSESSMFSSWANA